MRSVQSVFMAEEIHIRREISGRSGYSAGQFAAPEGSAGVAEEGVVEVSAFEEDVAEGVGGVPDEEEAGFGAGGGGEEAQGGEVGCCYYGEGGEEREDGCLVYYLA